MKMLNIYHIKSLKIQWKHMRFVTLIKLLLLIWCWQQTTCRITTNWFWKTPSSPSLRTYYGWPHTILPRSTLSEEGGWGRAITSIRRYAWKHEYGRGKDIFCSLKQRGKDFFLVTKISPARLRIPMNFSHPLIKRFLIKKYVYCLQNFYWVFVHFKR